MEQRGRSVVGWMVLLAVLAVATYVGLSRHHDGPSAAATPVAMFDASRGTEAERAESADVRTGILALTSPVDVSRLVRHFTIGDDVLTVVVNRAAYEALAPGDQDRAFADISTLWSRTYAGHHNGVQDRSLTLDFVDDANQIVHHDMLYPPQ
ncbi:MAG: hypothetical protein JWO85_2453 [Candidatus Eremiobacteraeota bacterium]|jgi:hypothetical protein|nr:hypothetical protein [Candidatus Eremiobacteraeota bacterium]